jgi:hypothetical protein
MDRTTKGIFLFLGGVLAVGLLLVLCVERVPVRTYGVKQYVWAGGIEQQDYNTGFRLGITGIHKWHFLDASTHFLDFTEADERENRKGSGAGLAIFPRSGGPADLSTPSHRREPALQIRNRDGNNVAIDVSIPYRIIPGEAHKIVEAGAKTYYQDRVKETVASVLREVLSEMTNEGFQDTAKRLATASKAHETLNKKLEQFHVKADAILIRRVGFPTEYEEKLQQKQLLTQRARLDEAETLRWREVLTTGTIKKEIAAAEALSLANWEKQMETLRQEYALQVAAIKAEALQYSMRTKAEADAVFQTKLAEGQLALDRAEARLTQLRSEALSTAGGRIYVARQAAENLKVGRVTLNASDPRVPLLIDVHKVAELLIGGARGPAPGAAPGEAAAPPSARDPGGTGGGAR